MPVLDGWGFRARQQELDGLSDIPVVVLSAAAGAERAAGKLGAAGVLPKPFELDRLLDTVRDLLGRAA